MSVSFQRISSATVEDIIIYDPAAEKRANSMGVDWNTYFNIGSQEILYMLQWGWWPKYVENTWGAYYFKNNAQGKLVTAFEPDRLVKTDQTLIRLDVFKAVEEFYKSLVTDVSNINEVDKTNYEFSQQRYQDEWNKAIQLSNFYKLYAGNEITALEENYQADADFFSGDRRYF
jgi:glycine cleavage system H lipoate-binding protein